MEMKATALIAVLCLSVPSAFADDSCAKLFHISRTTETGKFADKLNTAAKVLAFGDEAQHLSAIEALVNVDSPDSLNLDYLPHAAYFALKAGETAKGERYLTRSEEIIRYLTSPAGECSSVSEDNKGLLCSDMYQGDLEQFMLNDRGFSMRVASLRNGRCVPASVD